MIPDTGEIGSMTLTSKAEESDDFLTLKDKAVKTAGTVEGF